jgi:hypothetical protein
LKKRDLPSVTFHPSSLLGRTFQDDRWEKAFLPLERPALNMGQTSGWTYEAYFHLIRSWLSRNNYALLIRAVNKQLAGKITLPDIEEIRIFAEKHGSDYHPAKIEVITGTGSASLVVNVALTQRGQATMASEIRTLKTLGRTFSYPYLPGFYFGEELPSNSKATGKGRSGSTLFLADWFDGFYEFHLSTDPSDGTRKLALWNGAPKPYYLSDRQTGQVYRQTAWILTLYYNPKTYEQIFPWHHGAGDFVIKTEGEQCEVRLVTARHYGSIADPAEILPEEALGFFFLNLSLRNRLDRLDGIGAIGWADDVCLEKTWEGFTEALTTKEKEGVLPIGFLGSFFNYIKGFSKENLIERFSALLESYHPEAPDLPVINKHIDEHVSRVHKIFIS